MRRILALLLVALFVLSFLAVPFASQAQAKPKIDVRSQFYLNRYGYAVVNETVKFSNSGNASEAVPPISIGFGGLAGDIANHTLVGSGFVLTTSNGTGPFTVTGGSVPAGGASEFVLSVLLSSVVRSAPNETLIVQTLSWPSLSQNATTFDAAVLVPTSVSFAKPPEGYVAKVASSNTTYTLSKSNFGPKQAEVSSRAVVPSGSMDFHPLQVFSASRTISLGAGDNPEVTDKITFRNLGNTTLTSLYVDTLLGTNTSVTVLESTNPRLLSNTRLSVGNGTLSLGPISPGYPAGGVAAGNNFTVTYQYALGAKYFTESGGEVTITVPESPPVPAFIESYTIHLQLPAGVTEVKNPAPVLTDVNPWTKGSVTLEYGLSAGWALVAGVPWSAAIFVLLLLGLFVSRGSMTVEEEEEVETSSEKATSMVNTFDEKTDLINGFWPEISGKDPNDISKEYFDSLKARLDAFRSRALQRLNEMKQASTSQKFFDLLNQIQASEREVDRAAKDKLNLYEQFYLRRMKKEVYDRLLPQYTKRLERALNQLTDELHVVQKEAKAL